MLSIRLFPFSSVLLLQQAEMEGKAIARIPVLVLIEVVQYSGPLIAVFVVAGADVLEETHQFFDRIDDRTGRKILEIVDGKADLVMLQIGKIKRDRSVQKQEGIRRGGIIADHGVAAAHQPVIVDAETLRLLSVEDGDVAHVLQCLITRC